MTPVSMWLHLVKVTPSLLEEVRTRPSVLDALFFRGEARPGFRPVADSFGHDHRTLRELAEDRARVEHGAGYWPTAFPWLARAVGRGCAVVEGYGFRHGPAFVLPPDEVGQVAQGLAAERWSRTVRASDWDEGREERDLDDLVPFFAAAGATGRAVVGGVN
ncbi:hypothetical protein [Streptomyces sp. NPDC005955]|uniref:hypothetical protein n=1 Tax=Streptomyces sp. NPDC005955 TaxID=3364738 RepID=UPI0036872701